MLYLNTTPDVEFQDLMEMTVYIYSVRKYYILQCGKILYTFQENTHVFIIEG
jgi:hypothetical protein